MVPDCRARLDCGMIWRGGNSIQVNAMAFGVGLIADHRGAHGEFGPMLSQCGLSLSCAATANAFFRDAAGDGLLCVVIDLPGQRGLEALEF
jgi:hypothetical protein